ncbi:MAG: carboxypeptidase regulatory-like domain-containing protein [Gemmataceae bacterium]
MTARRLAVVTLAVALAGRTAAQDKRPTLPDNVVQFAPPTEIRDHISFETQQLDGSTNLSLRPNSQQGFSVYVRNESTDDREMTVEFLDTKDAILAVGTRAVPGKSYGRVTMAKPKPAAAPPPAVVVAPAPPPMPPVPPPPPGFEVLAGVNKKTTIREFTFRVRVTNNVRPKPLDAERDVLVTILQRGTYATVDPPRYTRNGNLGLIEVDVSAGANFAGPDCVVELQFPPQPTLDPTPREGVYRRTLTAGKKVKLSATVGINEKRADFENGTFYVVIDGVPRTVVYRLNYGAAAEKDVVVENPTPVVRLVEAGQKIPPLGGLFVSLPRDKFPLRIEVDPPASGEVAVRLNRSRTADFSDPDEVTTRDNIRHEQVFVDPAGEGGVMLVTTAVRDWVVNLDTRDMRGRYRLQGVVGQGANAVITEYRLILDDTPPDRIIIDTLPRKHMRGHPLPVRVFASDAESPIVKVAVGFARLTPEGKLPDGVVLVDALAPPPDEDGLPWIAQLPIPADKKGGPADIVVVATNAVGLSAMKPVLVQLIDPPTGGTITGVVRLGQFGKPQPGVTVVLKDADGKDKGGVKTNAKGAFVFEDVPPGGYKVGASMADAGPGTRGEAPVHVEAGKTTETEIQLTRKP